MVESTTMRAYHLRVNAHLSLFCGVQAAVKHIADRGILMVASAGNEGVDTDSTDHFPSTLPDDIIIAVAAGNRSDGIW